MNSPQCTPHSQQLISLLTSTMTTAARYQPISGGRNSSLFSSKSSTWSFFKLPIVAGSRCTVHAKDTNKVKTAKTRWLYCVEWTQYSIRLEGYLCTSCLLPAFNDAECHMAANEWCQCYLPCYLFTVSNPGLLFFHVSQLGGTAAYLVYSISNIKRCQKFGSVSCTKRTHPRAMILNWF